MLAIRQIIEDPQDVIPIPPEFRHRRTEVIFMALESESSNLPEQNLTAETVKNPRANWFDGYLFENDIDVLATLPADHATEEWEW